MDFQLMICGEKEEEEKKIKNGHQPGFEVHLGTLFVLAFKMREILYALRKKEGLGRSLSVIAGYLKALGRVDSCEES